jgi:hypothetical protein
MFMKTITQTSLIIRLFFLICVFSGALLSTIFSEKETKSASVEKQTPVTIEQQASR